MVERCASCNVSLGTHIQEDLFGGPKKCIDCQTKDRITMMLNLLPAEGELAFDRLRSSTQSVLSSVRRQFAKKKTLSPEQYRVLEEIYTRTV